MMDRIEFTINGESHSVGPEVDADVTLLDYIRNYQELRGTKAMCREGGCGACVVTARVRDHTGETRVWAVNACLPLVLQCHGWAVTTVEGVGGRAAGYHPVQRALAEHGGSQCGYCSVGWVMAMYSLLEGNNYDLTQYEIEDSFGSNNCRCTGYRPILEAFKSFAKDAPKPLKCLTTDIEDLQKCTNKGNQCEHTCPLTNGWYMVTKKEIEETPVKRIELKDGKIWYRVNTIKDIFDILDKEGDDSYMIVGGNTGRGAYHILEFPRVLIDVQDVSELKKIELDQNIIIGGNTTLTDLINVFETLSKENEDFTYLQNMADHLKLVAHIPVRNVGTVAGNLMVKYRERTFSSDIFLLLESVGAIMTIVDRQGSIIEVTPEDFLMLDMTGRVILDIKLPPLSKHYRFVSFKILPRAQNAHAQVNAAFLYRFDQSDNETVTSASIVFGGLSATFVHARSTETYLIGKKMFTNETLQGALKVLERELVVEEIPGELVPGYRKKAALGLFYKGGLTLIPKHKLNPRYHTGSRDLRKTRPLSKATEVYDTNPLIWPLTEPIPKVEALIQCAGEAKYQSDIPKLPREVFAAFVTSDVGNGDIISIDPTPALKIKGVLSFFSAKDIPGDNNFMPRNLQSITGTEEVLCPGTIKYYDQPIGIIVAETEALANRAALLVNVKYEVPKSPPLLTIEDVQARDPNRIKLFRRIEPKDKGGDVTKIIKSKHNLLHQYHYTMQTITCVAQPSENGGVDMAPSTQWTDMTQIAVARFLNIMDNQVSMEVTRMGGAYGIGISRSAQVSTACALVAYLMNRPCRFILSIQASMRAIGKRLPCSSDYEVHVNKRGEIQFMDLNFYEDNGFAVSEPIVALTVSAFINCYDSRRWRRAHYDVTTDTASNSWCRSPGTLEAISAIEHIMEQISYELNLNPVEVRLNNINKEETIVLEVLNTILKDSDYNERKKQVELFNKQNRWQKRGLRVTLMSWEIPTTSRHQVYLAVYHGDGSVIIRHGGIEIGQGLNTKVIQVVAYTLNLPKEKIRVQATGTATNPNTKLTAASRTTDSVCFGIIKCCQLLLDRLAPVRARLGNPTWEALIRQAHEDEINLQTSFHTSNNDIEQYRVAGATVAEVQLDILTGEHYVLRTDLIQDTGTSYNPAIDIGQIEGAFIMGLGYWTSEHMIYDKRTGELLTDRTWNYEVPGAKDIPIDFRVQLRRNSYNPAGILGARAVGEPSTCMAVAVPFALREAIMSSRMDSGLPGTQWFNVDGPFTLAANVLSANVSLSEFLYY